VLIALYKDFEMPDVLITGSKKEVGTSLSSMDTAQESAEGLNEQIFVLAEAGKSVELDVLLEDHPGLKVDEYRDDDCDWRALDVACLYGHTECVRLLIDHKADVNAKDEDGGAALNHATHGRELDCVKLLVQDGADVNCQDDDGWTPLIYCLLNGEIAIAHFILQNKADIHYRISEGDDRDKDALYCAMHQHVNKITIGCAFAILSCNTDANNVKIDDNIAIKIRDAHIEAYKHVQAHIDEYHSILIPVLSEHVQVDRRVGLTQNGIYQEPLERTLEYLGLSMSKDQVVNTSIDGGVVRRALIPGHLLNANHWFDKYKSR
jgi:hypothetical protein